MSRVGTPSYITTPANRLVALVEAMATKKLLVIGDVILDRYIWGEARRLSQEAPVPVVDVRKMEDRLGGATNTALNARNVGCNVQMAGLVGKDQDGNALRLLLDRSGIEAAGVLSDELRHTTVKTRVIAQSQQVVRVDHEDRHHADPQLRAALAKYIEQQVTHVDGVILSDYGKGLVTSELTKLLEKFATSGVFGLNVVRGQKPYAVDPSFRNYGLYQGITFAKPNRKEAEDATGISIADYDSAHAAAQVLIKKWSAQSMIISLGADGLLIAFADGSPRIELPTFARKVFDVSGAGDCVTAVFTAALTAGATVREAGELANIAAGYVVSEVGTVPIRKDVLLKEIAEVCQK